MKDDDDVTKQFNDARKDDEENKYSEELNKKIGDRARECLKAVAKKLVDQQQRRDRDVITEINKLFLEQYNLDYNAPGKIPNKSKEKIKEMANETVDFHYRNEMATITKDAERDIQFMVSQEMGGVQDDREKTPTPEKKEIDLTTQKITINFNDNARDPRGRTL